MTHSNHGCFISLAVLGALVLALLWPREPVGWRDMARMTGVQVPGGAVLSAVEHPTEVVYRGTIDLKTAAEVQAFIQMNGMTRMIEQVEADGWVHQGHLAYAVLKQRYADTWMLMARSEQNAWEFILDATTRRVSYEVLVPDSAGDRPWDSKPASGERSGEAAR